MPVNVQCFPYSAKGDGVTDDTPAFKAAIADLVAAGGGSLYVPRGTYVIKQAIKPDIKALVSLTIYGDGPGLTMLKAVTPVLEGSGVTVGVFSFTLWDSASQVIVRDLTFLAAAREAGAALTVTFERARVHSVRSLVVTDVNICGLDPKTDYFAAGIVATGLSRPLFRNVVITGLDPDGDASDGSPGFKMRYGI